MEPSACFYARNAYEMKSKVGITHALIVNMSARSLRGETPARWVDIPLASSGITIYLYKYYRIATIPGTCSAEISPRSADGTLNAKFAA